MLIANGIAHIATVRQHGVRTPDGVDIAPLERMTYFSVRIAF